MQPGYADALWARHAIFVERNDEHNERLRRSLYSQRLKWTGPKSSQNGILEATSLPPSPPLLTHSPSPSPPNTCVTYLRVSQSLTVMSYDPEISSNSLLGDQATEDTQPWCDVSVFFTTAPSERGKARVSETTCSLIQLTKHVLNSTRRVLIRCRSKSLQWEEKNVRKL